MTKFTKCFICRFALFCCIFSLLAWTGLKMYVQNIKFDDDLYFNYVPFCVFFFYGVLNCAFVIFLTIYFTKSLRIKGVATYPTDEFAFYRVFILIVTLLNIIFAVLIFNSFAENIESLYNEGVHMVEIYGYEQDYLDDLIYNLNAVKEKIIGSLKYALCAESVLQFVVLCIFAPIFVRNYQSPQK